MAGLIAVVAIRILGLEPIDLHWVDLLDLFQFVLCRFVIAWFEPPLPLVALLPGGSAPGDVVECDSVVSVSCVCVRDQASGVDSIHKVLV